MTAVIIYGARRHVASFLVPEYQQLKPASLIAQSLRGILHFGPNWISLQSQRSGCMSRVLTITWDNSRFRLADTVSIVQQESERIAALILRKSHRRPRLGQSRGLVRMATLNFKSLWLFTRTWKERSQETIFCSHHAMSANFTVCW